MILRDRAGHFHFGRHHGVRHNGRGGAGARAGTDDRRLASALGNHHSAGHISHLRDRGPRETKRIPLTRRKASRRSLGIFVEYS